MNHLLDVGMLLACAWNSHAQFAPANRWLDAQETFATCSATQMGFLRVSMSAAFGAGYVKARAALRSIVTLQTHHFVADKISAADLPILLVSRHDITDAHYVALAATPRLKLATLDDTLCSREWADGIAVNPLARALR